MKTTMRLVGAAGALALGVVFAMFFLLAWQPAQASPLGEALPGAVLTEAPGEVTNGLVRVEVWTRQGWQHAGSLPFNQFPAGQELDLSGLKLAGSVRLRLSSTAGAAAHLDLAELDGEAPRGVSGAVEGQPLALRKLSGEDHDLLDLGAAAHQTIELRFSTPAAAHSLRLVGRIEPEQVLKYPFHFPVADEYKEPAQLSHFYSYLPGSQPGALQVDGLLEEEKLGAPLFKTWGEPATGHPAGFTYAWVWDDGRSLYAALDFTPDNTMDGEQDYAELFARTSQGVRAFRVTTLEPRWGSAGFAYTPRAGYQHKVYEFRIPLAELGAQPGQALELAFGAYGTAALPPPYEGPYDPTWDENGVKAIFTDGATPTINDLLLQPDNKVLAVGVARTSGADDLLLVRLTATGELDTSFGEDGIVTTTLLNGGELYAGALQPDGKIVVVGSVMDGVSYKLLVARYSRFGLLDTSFGGGAGYVASSLSGYLFSYLQDVVIQEDGKIAAAGYGELPGDAQAVLARYLDDGSPDPDFGASGLVTPEVDDNSAFRSLALQPDGSLVAAGFSEVMFSSQSFLTARFTSAGDLDPGYGGDGIVTTTINTRGEAESVVLQPDGKILAGGVSGVGNYYFTLARYLDDGSLDPGFNATGVVTAAFGDASATTDEGNALALEPDGKIVLAGTTGGQAYLAFVRWNSDGSPDETIGDSGRVNFAYTNAAFGGGVVIQPDGKIVIGGGVYVPPLRAPASPQAPAVSPNEGLLLRYLPLDLVMLKTQNTRHLAPDDLITYTLAISNPSPAWGAGLRVTDTLPAEVHVLSVISSGASITPQLSGLGQRAWRVGLLDPGEQALITLTAQLKRGYAAGHVFTNSVSLGATGVQTDTTNDSDWVTATVRNAPPLVDIGEDQIVDEGDWVDFTAVVTDPNDVPGVPGTFSSKWYFGDGGFELNTFSASHLYSDTQVYPVALRVTDSLGMAGVGYASVIVRNVGPEMPLLDNVVVPLGQALAFTQEFTDPGLADVFTVTIGWGDGVTDTQVLDAGEREFSGSHVYSAVGDYLVTVVVTDRDGATARRTFHARVARLVYLPLVLRKE